MIKIFNNEESSDGWVVFDGSLDDARKHCKSKLREYDGLDCDNSWCTYMAIAVGGDIVEVWIGDYDYWLFNNSRHPAVIECVAGDRLSSWGLKMTELKPRIDYII